MKQLIISLTALMLLSISLYAVQVDGNCYLENQAAHEGTKVLFQADSPGAVTDSIYTNSSGYYQIDLSAGAYDVYYSHQGYFADEILGQLFFSATTLPEVTLAPSGVDGNCYLENQANHSGTKVLFQADSPGAVTDSAFTNSSGYYQIDLSAGAYDVFYSHQGYFGEEIIEQQLFSATTLPEVTLAPSGIEISGGLSGVLVDTSYLVTGNIWVSTGDSLIIEAGAMLFFDYDVEFTIAGYLFAAGTETDSIKFINSPDLTWGGFNFNSESDDSCLLEYCLIVGGNSSSSGIGCSNSSPIISNCTIRDNEGGGIGCSNSSPIISNCTISGNSAESGGGIYCFLYSSPTISNCDISDNSAEGFGGGIFCYSESSPVISNCIIRGNSANFGGGIRCYNSTPIISGNTISDNEGGGIHCWNSSPNISGNTISGNPADVGGGIWCYNSSPAISNCTISGNSAEFGGGIFCDNNSSPTIVNTIVEGNSGNGGIYFDESPDASLTYSDFYNNEGGNFSGSPPQYAGQIVTVNANGDSCDIYSNIFLDPQFVDPVFPDFNLRWGSPCIDAGDPESLFDPDSTITDIGAFYFDQYSWVKKQPELQPYSFSLSSYPNPFNAFTIITYEFQTPGETRLAVYNVQGAEIAVLMDSFCQPGRYSKQFKADDLSSGLYFVELRTSNAVQTQKILLVK